MKQWILRREQLGAFNALVNEFSLSKREDYLRFMRMNCKTFRVVLEAILPYITKRITFTLKPIAAEEKLVVTFRFLATGQDYESLSSLFQISASAIKQFVPAVCHYIYHILKSHYLKLPSKQHEWEALAAKNFDAWQFPHSIAAIDGKHVIIKRPISRSSEFWNFKGFHSIVLMAMVTYDYKFLFANVGCQGRISDGAVWANCEFSKKMASSDIIFPSPKPLAKSIYPVWEHHKVLKKKMPFVIVGESAFPLTENIMKPYPAKDLTDIQRIFNYRLSRFHRISKNTFGILVNRFGIFSKQIDHEPDTVVIIVRAAPVLHNLMSKSTESYSPPGFADETSPDGILNEGSWRNEDVTSAIFSFEQ